MIRPEQRRKQYSLVAMPGGGTSVWGASAFYYRRGDWLASSRFASTSSRTVYYDAAYAPFGQAYAESGTTDRNFTGMDQDIAGGLYDFPAREYNALEGRWPSPDPAGLASVNPADPQTWNRYAYVRNSPLMLTDPFGLDDSSCMPFYVIGGVGVWCPLPIIPILPIGPGGCISITIDGSSSPCSAPPSIPGGYGGGGGGGGGSAPGSGNGSPAPPASPTVTGQQPQTQTPPKTPTLSPGSPGVPPDPLACSPYLDGTGAGSALFRLCMNFPNGPWSNCVRAKLLDQYVPNGNPLDLSIYLVWDHPKDFGTCAVP